MVPISHNVQNVGDQADVIFGVENIDGGRVSVDVVQDVFDQLKTQVTVVAELVAEGPDDTVEDGLEPLLRERVEGVEVELDEGFQKGEEVGSDFGVGVEVRGD